MVAKSASAPERSPGQALGLTRRSGFLCEFDVGQDTVMVVRGTRMVRVIGTVAVRETST